MAVDTEKFSKDLNTARGALGVFGAQAVGMASRIQGSLGGAFKTGAAVAFIRHSQEASAASVRMATNIGVSTQALQGLQYAAVRSGLAADDLGKLMTKSSGKIARAAVEGGPVRDALNALGLDAKKLANQDPQQTLGQIADGFAQVKNPAERAALAMMLFEEEGPKFLGFLSRGSKGIAELRKEAEGLGLVLGSVDAANVVEAQGAVAKVGAAGQGLVTQLGAALAPLTTTVAEALTSLISTATLILRPTVEFIANLVNALLKPVIAGIKALASGFATLIQNAPLVGRFLDFKDAAKYIYDTKGAYDEAGKAAEANALAQAKLRTKVSETEAEFAKQVATFGKGQAEVKLYELAAAGATQEQLKNARALADKLKVMEEEKKVTDDLLSKAKSLTEGSSALAKYTQDMKALDHALKQGKISQDQFNEASDRVGKDLRKPITDEIASPVEKLNEKLKEAQKLLRANKLTTQEFAKYQKKLTEEATKGFTDSIASPLEKFREKFKELDKVKGLLGDSKYRKAVEKAKEEAFGDALRTPEQKFKERLGQLREALDAGVIDKKQFKRLRTEAEQASGIDPNRRAAALAVGSEEARSAFLTFRGLKSDDANKETAKNTKDIAAYQRTQLGYLAALARGRNRDDQELPF